PSASISTISSAPAISTSSSARWTRASSWALSCRSGAAALPSSSAARGHARPEPHQPPQPRDRRGRRRGSRGLEADRAGPGHAHARRAGHPRDTGHEGRPLRAAAGRSDREQSGDRGDPTARRPGGRGRLRGCAGAAGHPRAGAKGAGELLCAALGGSTALGLPRALFSFASAILGGEHAADKVLDDGHGQGRIGTDHGVEAVGRDDHERDGVGGDGRGRARYIPEEGELAQELPLALHAQELLLASQVLANLHLALVDQKGFALGVVTLLEDHVARVERPGWHFPDRTAHALPSWYRMSRRYSYD